ncbi:MAG: hypothetical protein IPO08_15425 [Xanthomonadales bacterium]|jgi:hypothetical protein|nr:hypothetical protein [Xanthomonadales bacterium]
MKAFCFFCLLARWILRRKIREDHRTLQNLLRQMRGWKNPFILKCYSLWAMLEAKHLGDPYALGSAYNIFLKSAGERGLRGNLVPWVLESAYWTKDHEILSTIEPLAREVSRSAQRITRDWSTFLAWREGSEAIDSSPESIRKFSEGWHFGWIGLFIEGLSLESAGNTEAAVNTYRIAYKSTPTWLPESTLIRDRIKSLRTQIDQETPCT